MNGNDFSLSKTERRVLEVLCDETFSTGNFVDAPSFRADHEELMDVIPRLCRLRYIDEDNGTQTYGPSVLTLKEVDNKNCKRVLEVGSKVLPLLYAHYKNKATRNTNLLVKDMTRQLGIERAELDLALMLLRNSMSAVLGTHMTDLRHEEAYVTASEAALKCKSMDDIFAVQSGWRDQALKSNGTLPPYESFLPVSKPKTSVFDSELVKAVPENLRQVLREIEIAIPSKMTCLAVMGLRTVLDMFSSDLLGSNKGTFKEKLSQLKSKNLLHDRQIIILDAALEVGHAAIHRGHVPSEEDCLQVLKIVEHLLREHYLLAPNASKLKATAPPWSS